MATLIQVRDRVRRKVYDYDAPQVVGDDYYNDAIDDSLGRLNADFGLSFASVEAVTVTYLYLLINLATIEICFIRAAKVADDVEHGTGAQNIDELEIPDLKVRRLVGTKIGSEFWIDLANRLMAEYEAALEQSGSGSQQTIATSTLHRQSLTNGAIAKRILDPGPEAVPVITSVTGGVVTVSWDILYDQYFLRYEILRADNSLLTDAEIIKYEADNQVNEYEDSDVTSGTWYYAVKSVNKNELTATSSAVETIVS